jgi:hypothetical protein
VKMDIQEILVTFRIRGGCSGLGILGSNPSFSANRCEFGCGGSVSVILESDF